jgi:hypothetical protein
LPHFVGSRVLGQTKPSFSPDDLIRIIQQEFDGFLPGVATHVSGVCIANTQLNHTKGYNYLW